MTYYEELGISAEATAEEIRQAHRRLVKLLHPDQQQDAELRKLADLQLMRVNSLVEELLDPQRRAHYNHRLNEPLAGVPVSSVPRAVLSRWQILAGLLQREWKLVLLGAVGIFLLVFASAQSPTDSVRSVPVAAQPQVKPVEQQRAAQLPVSKRSQSRRSAPNSRDEKPADDSQSPAEPQAPAPVDPEPPVIRASPAASTRSSAAASESSPSAVEAGKKLSFVGTWLYAGTNSMKKGSASLRYRPEYIELRITEDGLGGVRGDYRSRYAVTDLPISPTVDFVFGGDPAGPPMRWVAGNGATGTVALKLIQPNLLQVDWHVHDSPSGRIDLVRGSARLIRRL
jgi:curved DNA-binding protein CbpA